jgi:hypothetical protein
VSLLRIESSFVDLSLCWGSSVMQVSQFLLVLRISPSEVARVLGFPPLGLMLAIPVISRPVTRALISYVPSYV